jgi:hypothetical protein
VSGRDAQAAPWGSLIPPAFFPRMNAKLLLLVALSAFLVASAESPEDVCDGHPLVERIPCSAGFIVKVRGEETLDFCQMTL